MEAAFKKAGYKVQVRELSYFHDDYGLKAGENEEDEEDDSEDEDDEDDGSEDDSDDSGEYSDDD